MVESRFFALCGIDIMAFLLIVLIVLAYITIRKKQNDKKIELENELIDLYTDSVFIDQDTKEQ